MKTEKNQVRHNRYHNTRKSQARHLVLAGPWKKISTAPASAPPGEPSPKMMEEILAKEDALRSWMGKERAAAEKAGLPTKIFDEALGGFMVFRATLRMILDGGATEICGKRASGPGSGGERRLMAEAEAAEFLQQERRRYRGLIFPCFYLWTFGEESDVRILAFLAEVIARNEAALRFVAAPGKELTWESCEQLAAVNLARQIAAQVRQIGWEGLPERTAGESDLKAAYFTAQMPGLAGRRRPPTRELLRVLTDFLHEKRERIVQSVVREQMDIYMATELAEALALAEKCAARDGMVEEETETRLVQLCRALFVESQRSEQMDWNDVCSQVVDEWTAAGVKAAGKGGAA